MPRRRASWLLFLGGLLALLWFAIRVIPKPSRAAYPCQRLALPLASGFVLWLAGLAASAVAFFKARALYRRAVARAILPALLATVLGWLTVVSVSTRSVAARTPRAHEPLGTGQGVYPGRVVWVHDPSATDWGGTNDQGENIGYGFWWQSEHTDQAVVDAMMSRAVRGVAGQATDAAAWDVIFRYFNRKQGHGNVGYQTGEKVCIKVNLVTANRVHGNIDENGNQTFYLGWVNTSPQMIVALLRQLVHVVGVRPQDITVGDTTAYFPNHYWDYCHGEFPEVHYLACSGHWGRLQAESSEGHPGAARMRWSSPDAEGKTPDYLPLPFAEAAYLINFACLKGHSSGITLCAKNHYGSFIRLPEEGNYYDLHRSLPNAQWSPGMGHYRALVDITGRSRLGGRTLLYLIDGLYAGYRAEGRPYKWLSRPFGDGVNGDWPSSLFASLDAVAIDSVAYDFLLEEWPDVVTGNGSLQGGQEDYLHEAAQADHPPSGTFYDPDGAGLGLASLGTHEHWNNVLAKRYSRNLGLDVGIELLWVEQLQIGDLNCDGAVNFADINAFVLALSDPAAWQAAYPDCHILNGDINGDGKLNFADINPFVELLSG